ncbi:BQ5605_C010g06013 [Microbotryum silenes-dioicae]|uniref:BQ5605_C010g06013 protein n=1 Tax=Microbotryum silenes-dioicae TaxID=796604 RepID=A0A2X0LQD9_9BASI|nr:BQ5605_C010g06013 [Microbotryum silenes-dioicae]
MSATNIPNRNDVPGGIAPTPQNTPAAHLSHSVMSRPQVPSTLSEEQEDDDLPTIQTDGASGALAALSGHPAFTHLIQGKLDRLVGQSSGYIESLPLPVRRRITGLKGVQAEHSKIEAEFQREIFELEKKYAEKYAPLYDRRRALIDGTAEPTEEEVEKGYAEEDALEDEDEDEDDEDNEDEQKPAKERLAKPTEEELAEAPKGIPQFWLTALKNHLGLSELITERDEEALKFLADIRVAYPADKPGFTLVFEFAAGAKAFFSNTKLEKTYYYQDEVGYEGDFVYDHAVGTTIEWVDGKDLTTRVETKKQRNKSKQSLHLTIADTNQTRIVKKVVPTDSFFSFFSPPSPPSDEDSENDIDEDIDEKLELDYQIGEDIKERVVPRAVSYFDGSALRHEQMDEFDSDEFDDEEDEEEEDSDEDDEGLPVGRGGSRKAPMPPSGVTPASAQDPQE